MSHTAATDDGALLRRVDELQTRLEFLESVVLDEIDEPRFEPGEAVEPAVAVESVEAAVPDEAPQFSYAEITPEPAVTLDPEQRLRKLQAETTADFPDTPVKPPIEPPKPLLDIRDIEERLAGRALALVGGTALLLGAVFFLSLAFGRGWIGPGMQVALGLGSGSVGLLVGGFLLFRGERIVGQVLTAVGLAVISLSLFAATSLYELIEPALALVGVLIAAAVTTFVALRSQSQVVAGFGLIAVMAAPPIMGAEPDFITVAYMAVALVGIAVVSMWQSWWWLSPIAFLLSLPQLYQWIATEPQLTLAVPALFAYWAVMTVAAGGEAFRSGRRELTVTSAPLFMAVGASVIGLAFVVLEADAQRAAFLLVLAGLHGLVTAFFARRRGLLDPFGLLAGAYGLAIATAAVPLLLDASATVVVWSAEAAVLAFFAGRRSHGPAFVASLVLYIIAAAELAYEVVLLSPARNLFEESTAAGSVEGAVVSFAFYVAAGLASMAFVPMRSYHLTIAGLIALVALPVVYMLFDGVVAVTAWVVIAVLAVGAGRWVALLPERHIRWRLGPALHWLRPTVDMTEPAKLLTNLAGIAAMMLAMGGTIAAAIDWDGHPTVPFTDRVGLSALALAGGFVVLGLVTGGAANLRRGLFAAGLTIGLISSLEVPMPWFALVWVVLAIGAALMSRVDGSGFVSYRRMALGSLAMLALIALFEAPPTRLVVDWGGVPPHPLFVSDATVVLAALAAGLVAAAAIGAGHWPSRLVLGLGALAGGTVLYLLSVGVVAVFAGEAHALGLRQGDRLDELVKAAQVAVSILWTTVGVVVLGLGLVLRRASLRIAGLAVLGLATVKVFLVDLSSLDVAYRVITLIVLGLLLIVSAYAWGRMKPRDGDAETGPAVSQEPAHGADRVA